jgi:hypothetical protein
VKESAIKKFHIARKWRLTFLLMLLLLVSAYAGYKLYLRRLPIVQSVVGGRTIPGELNLHGAAARARVEPRFAAASLAYPPKQIAFLGLKEEKLLQVYAKDAKGKWKFVHAYPIQCASGNSGPKLREGDGQVPEGFYRIEYLEPNTPFHLAMRVNYPNEFDLKHAQEEGRTSPGGDIMIHGSNCSIGCLAMGDEASEDLFVLVADTGVPNVQVLLMPHDLRLKEIPTIPGAPTWLPELYNRLATSAKDFPPTN